MVTLPAGLPAGVMSRKQVYRDLRSLQSESFKVKREERGDL